VFISYFIHLTPIFVISTESISDVITRLKYCCQWRYPLLPSSRSCRLLGALRDQYSDASKFILHY